MLRPEPKVAFERLARDFAARQQADERAMAELRRRLPEAVRLLVERFGARRVVLFGSLASGLFHHARSDVDLAVAGLDFVRLAEAEPALEKLLERRVDLLPIEGASAALNRELAERGEVLHGS